MKGFHVSASGAIEGHHGPVVLFVTPTNMNLSNLVGRIDNFRALARKLSFLPTELDIFDIWQHYAHILFIFQRLIY